MLVQQNGLGAGEYGYLLCLPRGGGAENEAEDQHFWKGITGWARLVNPTLCLFVLLLFLDVA